MASKRIDINELNKITVGDIKQNSEDTPKLEFDKTYSVEFNKVVYKDNESNVINKATFLETEFDSDYIGDETELNIENSKYISGSELSQEYLTLKYKGENRTEEEEIRFKTLKELKESYYFGKSDDAKELDSLNVEDKKNGQEVDVFNNEASENKDLDLDITDLKNKIQDDNIVLDIFLKNIFPVIGTNIANSILSIAGSTPTISGTLSTIHSVINLIVQAKYLTPTEAIMYLGSNFYTLHFIRGITIKRFTGFFATPWTGSPDITFGKFYNDLLPSFSDILGSIQDIVTPNVPDYPYGANSQLEEIKERISPIFEDLTSQTIYENRQKLESDPLSPGNKRLKYITPAGKFYFNSPNVRDGKWIEDKYQKYADNSIKRRDKISTNEDDYLINQKVMNIKLSSEENISKSELDSYRPDVWSIGYVYVMPQSRKEEFKNFKIPFEFNPEISTGGVTTNYNAQTILSRIGALQTFSHVDLSTVEISTEYFALADEEDEKNNRGSHGNSWMDYYTLSALQGAQKGYESLSYPFFPNSEDQNVEKGFEYIKPPLVKIIIGEMNDDDDKLSPYANLLTYPKNESNSLNEEFLASSTKKRLYKTFIVTSVNIEKDLNATPLYIHHKDGKSRLSDTFGFKVSLSLVEVSKNYMDVMPNYENYFNQFQNTVNENLIEA